MSIGAVIEESESRSDLMAEKMSRQISIVSLSEDEKTSTEKDEQESKDNEMDELMQRIQKQRSVLEDILGHEPNRFSETKPTKDSEEKVEENLRKKEVEDEVKKIELEENETSQNNNQNLSKQEEETVSHLEGSRFSKLQKNICKTI